MNEKRSNNYYFPTTTKVLYTKGKERVNDAKSYLKMPDFTKTRKQKMKKKYLLEDIIVRHIITNRNKDHILYLPTPLLY